MNIIVHLSWPILDTNFLSPRLAYLKDSNAAAHSVDSDIF